MISSVSPDFLLPFQLPVSAPAKAVEGELIVELWLSPGLCGRLDWALVPDFTMAQAQPL